MGIEDMEGTEADGLCRGGGGSRVLIFSIHHAKNVKNTHMAGTSTTSPIALLSNSIKTLAVSAPSPRI